MTAVVYERGPLARLAAINASPDATSYLSGLDVSGRDATGRRLIASGWVRSNCASTWNGKYIRIDQLSGSSVKNLLARDLYAHDRYGAYTVAVQVQRDVVTFRYDGGIENPDLLFTPAVARYRIVQGRAVREVPIALTRAGFIQEWLSMTDADPKIWAEPQAVGMRATVAPAVEKHGFDWANVAHCDGSPPVWEVAVRLHDLDKIYVFRISGARATELRMVGIGEKLTQSCVPEDMTNNLTSLGSELPE